MIGTIREKALKIKRVSMKNTAKTTIYTTRVYRPSRGSRIVFADMSLMNRTFYAKPFFQKTFFPAGLRNTLT